MASNKVKQFRTQQKMSQRELAAKAGTSQQQIQRIESGSISTGLDTARSICNALQKPFEVVFPEAAKALAAFHEGIQRTHSIGDDDLQKVSDAGIEADGAAWYLEVQLESAQEPQTFQVIPQDKRRLYRAIQRESDSGMSFVVFDSPTHRVALNLAQVVTCHFLMEPQGVPEAVVEEEDRTVRMHPVGRGSLFEIDADPDEPEDDGLGQLGHIFYMLEMGAAPGERFHIVDYNGEDAFLRAGSIAAIEVPLRLLTEAGNEDEEDEEQDEDDI